MLWHIRALANVLKKQRAMQTSFDKEDSQCLQDLLVSNPHDDKTRIENAKGGLLYDSYVWVCDNNEYKKWFEEPEHPLLWIRGDPGKGKTMLLCGIIDELTKSDPQQCGHIFLLL